MIGHRSVGTFSVPYVAKARKGMTTPCRESVDDVALHVDQMGRGFFASAFVTVDVEACHLKGSPFLQRDAFSFDHFFVFLDERGMLFIPFRVFPGADYGA